MKTTFILTLILSLAVHLGQAQCVYNGFPSNVSGVGPRPIVYQQQAQRCWDTCPERLACSIDTLGDYVLAVFVPNNWLGYKVEFIGLSPESSIVVMDFGCNVVLKDTCGIVDSLVFGGDTTYTFWMMGPVGDTVLLSYSQLQYQPTQTEEDCCGNLVGSPEFMQPRRIPETFRRVDLVRGTLGPSLKLPSGPGLYLSSDGRKIIVTNN